MPINSSLPSTRIKGAMTTFENMYLSRFSKDPVREKLKLLMDFIPSKNNARDETFIMPGDSPGFKRWDEGSPRVYGTVGDQSWNVPIVKWQNAVQWARIDEEDDLYRIIGKKMRSTVDKAFLVDLECFFQLLQASTDPDRLRYIPTCADGLAMFSSSRVLMHPTAGNVLPGSGVQTISQIKADFFEALERFREVRDTHNDLYHPDGRIEGRKVIIVHPANHERFLEAFNAKIIRQGEAGVENILATSSIFDVDIWVTPRITGDSWYMFLADMPEKPIFALERNDIGGIQQIYVNEQNSDHCRDNDVRQILYRFRKGYGYSLPLGAWKVSNT